MTDLIVCSLCRTGPADIEPGWTGYCAACEETLAEQLEAVIEAAMPIVFEADPTSKEIVRSLWRNGWRVASRSTHDVATCRECGKAEIGVGRAGDELARAVQLVQAARRADATLAAQHKVRGASAEARHWITLAASVFRHLFTAAMLLQCCGPCVDKVQARGRLVHLG